MPEQTCTLPHQHYVFWQPEVVTAISTATNHAFTEDTDPQVTEADIEAVRQLVDQARAVRTPFLPVSAADLQAIERVIGLACEYMSNNYYADDDDFPEDAQAAQILQDGHQAWTCEAALRELTGGKP